MILKNNSGKKREVNILFEVEKGINKYVIYKDNLTNNIYASKYKENLLDILEDEEYEYLNNLLNKFYD